MPFNNDSTLQPSVEHRHLTLCILFGSFVSRRGIKSRHLFCVLIKMLYWRRRLIGERDFLGEGLIGERSLLDKGAHRRKRLFFVGGLFWERGLIRERSLLERGAFLERGFFGRESFLGERLIGERGFSSRKCLRYFFMVWSITVYIDFSGVDCGSKVSYISFFFPFINSFISLCLHRVKTALQQFT